MKDVGRFIDNNAERIIALIRLFRPKLYNSLTWAVVTAGLALIGTNIFEEVLVEWLNIHLGLHLNLDALPTYGLILVAIGLTYHLAARYLFEVVQERADSQKQERLADHDRRVFSLLMERAPSQQIMDAFDTLANDELRQPYSTVLQELYHFRDLPDNRFLTPSIEKCAAELDVAVKTLLNFVATYFFCHPANQSQRTVLLPDLNIDRGAYWSAENERKYREKSRELAQLNKAAAECYERFREQVKTTIAM